MSESKEEVLFVPLGSRRPPGRPRIVEDAVPVSSTIPSASYDRLLKMANERGESLAGIIRTLLTLRTR